MLQMRDDLTKAEGTIQVKHPMQLLGDAYD
jgi:hypothetical protein